MPRPAESTVVTPVTDWTVASANPDRVPTPAGLDALTWLPARVPGTVAGALRQAGQWTYGDSRDLDADDWWFRTGLTVSPTSDGEEIALRIGGIATLSEVFLDGTLRSVSGSMFAAHEIDLGGRAHKGTELAIRCRALSPVVATPKSPRARWRSRVAAGGLRHHRTMLLGRAPGFAPGPAAVGPWRTVTVERRRDIAVDEVRLRCALTGQVGRLAVTARLRGLGGATIRSVTTEIAGPSGTYDAPLAMKSTAAGVVATGDLTLPEVAPWWPHTHGEPSLYQVRLGVVTDAGRVGVDAGRVGFRVLEPGPSGHSIETDGLDLRVNGVPIFARGAVWTPLDFVGLAPTRAAVRDALVRARDAGMNMLRVVGLAAYESPTFHDLCDELGLLVWQDFMFANFDYPLADEGFRVAVEAEARAVLADLGWRPSTAVLCGNSEVEQQAAMVGLAPDVARGELFGELLPRLIGEAEVDAPYVPSAPCGGDLPFRPGRGIANYYGVGGYRRPLSDVRLSAVRFASECLAVANLPDDPELASVGVARDVGAPWDFADVRDYYAGVFYGIDVPALRRDDPLRYLELGRAVSGELMAEVFGEWRRAASPCGGGLVLWYADLEPGAGWGVLDHLGEPKVAYHHLRRALAPIALWITDEGLDGLDVHVANDRAEPLRARLRVSLYHNAETLVEEVGEDIVVAAHAGTRRGVEELVGRFVDASYAYRFGPPAVDVVVASLEVDGAGGEGRDPISQAVRFPAGRPIGPEPADRLGLRAAGRWVGDDLVVTIHSRRLAHGVRWHLPGFDAGDNAFSVEPGGTRTLRFRRAADGPAPQLADSISALNLAGRIGIDLEGEGR